MSNIIDSLSGKKTYIVALAMIVYGCLALIFKFSTPDAAWSYISQGSAILFLRSGVAKAQDAASLPEHVKLARYQNRR